MNTFRHSPIEEDATERTPVNLLFSLIGAFFMTFFLIFGMEKLIRTDYIFEAPEPFVVPNPILPPIEPPTTIRDTKIEKPVEPSIEPDLPRFEPKIDSQGTPGIQISNYRPSPDPVNIHAYSSNAPIPTVMVQPDYPRRAAQSGIEGYVDVGFDVASSGMTSNIKVVEAKPEGYFERAAMKAVERWRFSPLQRDGKPVASPGMVHRIVFEMQK